MALNTGKFLRINLTTRKTAVGGGSRNCSHRIHRRPGIWYTLSLRRASPRDRPTWGTKQTVDAERALSRDTGHCGFAVDGLHKEPPDRRLCPLGLWGGFRSVVEISGL